VTSGSSRTLGIVRATIIGREQFGQSGDWGCIFPTDRTRVSLIGGNAPPTQCFRSSLRIVWRKVVRRPHFLVSAPERARLSALGPGCVKTHTSGKCRKYNSPIWLQPYVRSIISSYEAQFIQDVSTRAAGVGVFTRPRSKADNPRATRRV
jgi:hypothetical protein